MSKGSNFTVSLCSEPCESCGKRPWRLEHHSDCALIVTDQNSFHLSVVHTCYLILYCTFTKTHYTLLGLLLLFVLIYLFHYFIFNLRKNSIFGNRIKVSVSSLISLMSPFFSQQADRLAVALPNHSLLSQM